MEKMKLYLHEIQQRLTNVVIENKCFEDIIVKYDSQETLFYLDPPYFNAEKHYVSEFTQDHHELLSQLLKNIKGKFILSYNDDEYIRNLYKDFDIIEIERNNNLTSRYSQNRRYKELLIKNY